MQSFGELQVQPSRSASPSGARPTAHGTGGRDVRTAAPDFTSAKRINRGGFASSSAASSSTASSSSGLTGTGLPGTGLPSHEPAELASQFVGASTVINAVRDIATSIAPRRSTVMLLGETGTGKEMLARHIHSKSDRAAKPFVPVDCSAMTESLFESQMFGHVKGAFTGAVRDSIGFIRSADGGTMFLDEVGELPLTLQAKLLRVLQERAVVSVGDTRSQPVDIRVICATHRDLSAMVRAGTFRQDLFFRLNVVVMNVPPLRERPDDVVLLCEHFLNMQAELYDETPKTLSDDAIAALRSYSWPGNVRELSNVIEHAHVLSVTGEIRFTDLPSSLRQMSVTDQPVASDLRLVDVERRTISEALHRTDYCKAAASRLLGLNIQRLNRRIRSLGIQLPAGK